MATPAALSTHHARKLQQGLVLPESQGPDRLRFYTDAQEDLGRRK